MHFGNGQGPPVVYATQPASFSQNIVFKQLIVFGSLQIGFGVFSFLLQSASLAIFTTNIPCSYTFVGYGFWTGSAFIVTGSFGIVAGIKRRKSFTIVFHILSMSSAVLTSVLFAMGIASAVTYGLGCYYYFQNIGAQIAGIVMESLMTITAVAEAIVAIWSSVVCCKMGLCCCDCGGDCCCPPSPDANQIQNSVTSDSVFGQYPAVQQHPVIRINGFNQPQANAITNQQQPVTYTLPNGQQLIIMPNAPQETGEVTSDRANLIA